MDLSMKIVFVFLLVCTIVPTNAATRDVKTAQKNAALKRSNLALLQALKALAESSESEVAGVPENGIDYQCTSDDDCKDGYICVSGIGGKYIYNYNTKMCMKVASGGHKEVCCQGKSGVDWACQPYYTRLSCTRNSLCQWNDNCNIEL